MQDKGAHWDPKDEWEHSRSLALNDDDDDDGTQLMSSGGDGHIYHCDLRTITCFHKNPNVAMVELKKPVGQGTRQLQNKGEKSHETIQVLRNCNSPLRSIDLKDVVTYEEFVNHFTHEEQLQLMKYLPSVDTFRLPESLKSMFDSLLFAENLSSFQKLLAEGVFDRSLSEVDADEFKTLKKLALVNLTKSNWIEHYNLLKDVKNKQKTGAKELATGSKMLHVKRPRNGQNPQGRPSVVLCMS
ncbi:hypothetical protein AQUCO_52100002v1 [Aquilegia coerulea]|uniref:DEUBAD domain-containing protein n=1 Tax=Aquilegia coerulea TaxID=218851 RepID=A0A2G5C0E4_AQUCA|nr:hypothetical protein AQUCO_52100002v1 [Aquilegia coerulea]